MIGGTALSMQIGNRLSEDIDFCRWKGNKSEKQNVNCTHIEKEFSKIGEFRKDILSDNQVDYIVNNVKISFFCNYLNKQPVGLKPLLIKGNLKIADLQSIGIMKLEVMLYRSTYRDYYDIYSIVKEGIDFNAIVKGVLEYSNHKLRTRDILSMLSDSTRFPSEKGLHHLSPKYNVSPKNIEDFLRSFIQNYNNQIINEQTKTFSPS